MGPGVTAIDVAVSEPHFLEHAAPVLAALPPDRRGVIRVFNGFTGIDGRLATEAIAARLGIGVTIGWEGEVRPTLTASVGDAARTQKAGRSAIALIEHGSGQSFGADPDPAVALDRSYPGGKGRGMVGLFIAPNAHAAGRDAARYPAAATAVVGCPKLDAIPARNPASEPVIAVSFHWDCRKCPETQTGWPEFKAALPWLARRYRMIGHAHPRIIDELEPEYKSMGIEVVRSFRDVLARASVYINEGSSTLFEAAAAGIPVIPLNPSFFRRHVLHGLRFYEAAGVGRNVSARNRHDNSIAGKLVEAIEEALADPPERRAGRDHALAIVYAHRGDAARRAADALLEWTP